MSRFFFFLELTVSINNFSSFFFLPFFWQKRASVASVLSSKLGSCASDFDVAVVTAEIPSDRG